MYTRRSELALITVVCFSKRRTLSYGLLRLKYTRRHLTRTLIFTVKHVRCLLRGSISVLNDTILSADNDQCPYINRKKEIAAGLIFTVRGQLHFERTRLLVFSCVQSYIVAVSRLSYVRIHVPSKEKIVGSGN